MKHSMRGVVCLSAAGLIAWMAGCATGSAGGSSGTSGGGATVADKGGAKGGVKGGKYAIELRDAGVAVHLKSESEWVAVIDGKEAPVPAIEMGDPAVVKRIIEEGALRSQVMETLHELAVERGPRLTASTNMRRAQDFAAKRFKDWGLTNVHLEQWGTVGVGFDRGPSAGTVFVAQKPRREARGGEKPGELEAEAKAQETAPLQWTKTRDMQISALSWSIGTNGAVRGPVVREPQNEAEYAAIKDKLKGAWVLLKAPAPIGQRGVRNLMSTQYELRKAARKKVADGTPMSELSIAERMVFEPIAGYVSSSRDERVWTGAVAGWRDLTIDQRDSFDDDQPHAQVRLSDYDYINSRLADGETVELEFNLDHTFRPGPVPDYNVVAEIKGSKYPEEVIIISGHLDSWDGPGSQGATDNGTGSAVTMEAARILRAAGARPLRTIRFVLWSGEEQGLLGSKGYIESHKSELDTHVVTFVDDGGTGYQAGVAAPNNMVEMLAAATAPINNVFWSIKDQKYLNANIKPSGDSLKSHGGSDHAAFNAVGVPGFFWEEGGRADYGYGWHTQNDRIDLAIPEYLMQSATNSAVAAYRLGCAPTPLPRAEKTETGGRPNMMPQRPAGS
ncbi:MAG TPA: M20/M25/M40 family metallo-hydrolase [Phycisphaerales bacterium]